MDLLTDKNSGFSEKKAPLQGSSKERPVEKAISEKVFKYLKLST
jgi:hypothetical protein